MKIICSILWLIFTAATLTLSWMSGIEAAPPGPSLVKVKLISEVKSVSDRANTVWIGLHQVIEPGWHTYWRYGGDAGLPTRIKWLSSRNAIMGQIEWPLPKNIRLGPLVNYGYENETLLLIPVRILSHNPISLEAMAEWLVCKDICIPERKKLNLEIPQGPGEVNPSTSSLFAKYRDLIPSQLPWPSAITRIDGHINLTISVGKDKIKQLQFIRFFPTLDGLIMNAAPQITRNNGNNLTVILQPGHATLESLKSFQGVVKLKYKSDGKFAERAYRTGLLALPPK